MKIFMPLLTFAFTFSSTQPSRSYAYDIMQHDYWPKHFKILIWSSRAAPEAMLREKLRSQECMFLVMITGDSLCSDGMLTSGWQSPCRI